MPRVRPEVLAAIRAQNQRLAPSPARDQHLSALAEGAAAVVTGQQVGLFLGPLFTIIKAATAVHLARRESAASGRAVVPLFWLQTEDHDLPEIAETFVPAAHGAEAVALRVPADAADRRSVAHRVLPPEVEPCLATLATALAGLPHAGEHLTRLGRHYRAGASWTAAFSGVLAELFADAGLVFVDPRDEVLARAVAPLHQRVLIEAGPIADLLRTRSEELVAAGQAAPVHVRAGAPLSFFHPEGRTGPRFRLEPGEDERLHEVGGTRAHTLGQLLAALASDPLQFSSSVLLRPLVQDSLLPTLAYVGGPGELAYFAQLPPLYAHLGIAMPRIVPRARMRIIDPGVARSLEKLGLCADDAALDEDALLARAAGAAAPGDAVRRQLLDPFEAAAASLAPALAGTPELERALSKTRGTVAWAIDKLAAKIARTTLHRDHERADAVKRIRMLLHPDGMPQERRYGLAAFAARAGESTLIQTLTAAAAPFEGTVKDVWL